jgi:hypothetical protein
MELDKIYLVLITTLSMIVLVILDIIDITRYIYIEVDVSSIISNIISFFSIIIGSVSTIYVMIQSIPSSKVLELFRKENVIDVFNSRFKSFIYIGLFSVILLILFQCVENIIYVYIYKSIMYITFFISICFILITNNFLGLIINMIISEEKIISNQKDEIKEDFDVNKLQSRVNKISK